MTVAARALELWRCDWLLAFTSPPSTSSTSFLQHAELGSRDKLTHKRRRVAKHDASQPPSGGHALYAIGRAEPPPAGHSGQTVHGRGKRPRSRQAPLAQRGRQEQPTPVVAARGGSRPELSLPGGGTSWEEPLAQAAALESRVSSLDVDGSCGGGRTGPHMETLGEILQGASPDEAGRASQKAGVRLSAPERAIASAIWRPAGTDATERDAIRWWRRLRRSQGTGQLELAGRERPIDRRAGWATVRAGRVASIWAQEMKGRAAVTAYLPSLQYGQWGASLAPTQLRWGGTFEGGDGPALDLRRTMCLRTFGMREERA
ncbi:hypothetical protein OH77DRAFT_1435815 [Trametes cingulata]|nr:hypothetical protein OH77DRAFT_1435815 [Trametes cingulata]